MGNGMIYLMATLFNARATMSSYYRAEVNHDMPQFAGENLIELYLLYPWLTKKQMGIMGITKRRRCYLWDKKN